jgi:hypothetical protein
MPTQAALRALPRKNATDLGQACHAVQRPTKECCIDPENFVADLGKKISPL